jgi:hypothetical protein
MGIALVTTFVNAVAGFVIGFLVGAGGTVAGVSERGTVITSNLLSLPLSLLVMAGMNAALLPTTFGRGFLVALCYLLVALFVVAVLAVIFGGIYLLYTLVT